MKNHENGFTLVESIIALGIVSIAFAGLATALFTVTSIVTETSDIKNASDTVYQEVQNDLGIKEEGQSITYTIGSNDYSIEGKVFSQSIDLNDDSKVTLSLFETDTPYLNSGPSYEGPALPESHGITGTIYDKALAIEKKVTNVGEEGNNKGVYSKENYNEYRVGDYVYHDGFWYLKLIINVPTKNDTPQTIGSGWQKLCINYEDIDYQNGYALAIKNGDYIIYKGNYYKFYNPSGDNFSYGIKSLPSPDDPKYGSLWTKTDADSAKAWGKTFDVYGVYN